MLGSGLDADIVVNDPRIGSRGVRMRRVGSGVELVNVNATVTDARGRFVDGLTRDDFVVYEDGELVEFEYSNRKASYLGERLRSGGVVTAVDLATGTATVELHIKNAQGAVISPGRAVVRLRA